MRRRRFFAHGLLILAACKSKTSSASRVGDESQVSRVISARDPAYSKIGQAPDEQVAGEMIARVLRELTGTPTLQESWRAILGNAKVVGLKPNCLSGRGVASSPAFVNALCRQLVDNYPGLEKIIIWERSDKDLRTCGFEIRTSGRIMCLGNDRGGYHQDLIVEGSIGSLVSSFVVDQCDALINLPVFKDHGIVGISVGLKNYYGAVHNPNKYHLNHGDPYVADLNRMPVIRSKNVLSLCEAFTAQYEGGPPFMPQWSWPAGLVLASTDPVALDRVCWRTIEEKRKEKGLPTLAGAGREPTYILTAADSEHRLGQADLKRIKEIVLT
ncbi:MAG TPA: DUF362 domain-containing protein [archaeon]|nr:DUF362 domain-containing protein [archaeon]